ncbi:hypothetical protein Tco_1299883 [Tanacetum coccineum]
MSRGVHVGKGPALAVNEAIVQHTIRLCLLELKSQKSLIIRRWSSMRMNGCGKKESPGGQGQSCCPKQMTPPAVVPGPIILLRLLLPSFQMILTP